MPIASRQTAHGGKQLAQIQQDARQEARLRDTQQKQQNVEYRRRLGQSHRRREYRPRNHDAGYPAARTHAMQDEITRYLGHEVTDEEDADAETVGRIAESEVAQHRRLRETDIHPVELGDDVADEQQRHEAPRNLAEYGITGSRMRNRQSGRDGFYGHLDRFLARSAGFFSAIS